MKKFFNRVQSCLNKNCGNREEIKATASQIDINVCGRQDFNMAPEILGPW